MGERKERRKWKNMKSEEGKKMYRRLNNELRRETEKARENWLKDKCEEIESLEREGKFEMMSQVAMELVSQRLSLIHI